MKKRNNAIEFFRFILCCTVFFHHFKGYGDGTAFSGGYLGVDIFFVISGFFLMKHFAEKETDLSLSPERATFSYLQKRISKLIPHHVFSWLIMAVITILLLRSYSVSDVLCYGCWEFFLLKATGLGNNITVNGVTWYLSALVICSYCIYWILCCEKKYRNNNAEGFTVIIGPFIYALVISWMWNTRNDLNYWVQSAPVFTGGFLRGLSEMSLGCSVYAIVEALKKKCISCKQISIFATFFEMIGWFGVFVHMYGHSDKNDFIIPLFSALLLVSMCVCDSYFTRLLNNRISAFLGRISYPMFLNQFIVIKTVSLLFPGKSFWKMTLLSLFILIAFSICTDRLVKIISGNITGINLFRKKESL